MPRNYKHTKRGKTLNYDPQQLEQALEAHKNGLSIRKAAAFYNVPRSTLADRVTGKLPIYAKHGRPTAIPSEVEAKIVKTVKAAAEKGIGLSRKQLLLRTNILCKRVKVHPSYQNFNAGKNWWEGMKRRHNLSLRKPERLGTTRCRMMNREVVSKYFDSLELTMKNLGLDDKPEQIWNCDETSKNFEHEPVRVVAGTGIANVCGRTSAKSTNITIMACVNAAGSSMPPMFVVKGKTPRSLYSFNTQAAPIGTKWSFQDKGWMTDQIGEQWFDNVFLENCGPHRPQLLILDGHSSHESLAILQRAIEENVHIFALPPHTTHHLQPLDKAVFGPFNKAYNSVCSEFLQDPMHVVNKWSFPALIKKAWEASFTEGNIKSGFAVCGIYPLNKNVIPLQAFAPSIPTDRPLNSVGIRPNQPSATNAPHEEPLQACDHGPSQSLPLSNKTVIGSPEPNIDISPTLPNQQIMSSDTSILSTCSTQTVSIQNPTTSPSASTADSTGYSNVNIDAPVILDMLCNGNLVVEEQETPSTSSFLSCTESLNYTISPSKCLETIVDPSPMANWNQAIDEIFLPPTSKITETKTKRKSITSHRLLTSQEIITEKIAMETRKLQKANKPKKQPVKKRSV